MPRQQEILKTLTVESADDGTRLDAFLARHMDGFSRSRLQKAIESGAAMVDDKPRKASFKLSRGEQVSIRVAPSPASELTPVAMNLDILFEDESIIVINKPAGLVVHPGAGTGDAPTLIHGLLHHGSELSDNTDAGFDRPGIVHRLDKDTTGAMVIAKTERAHNALARQFHDKTNRREYIALLDGILPHHDVIRESYLFRDPASRVKFASMGRDKFEAQPPPGDPSNFRLAISHFTALGTYGQRLTLARARLKTGRTHQIRLHARDLRAPVIGDLVYHRPCQPPTSFPRALRERLTSVDRQMLHARLLGFAHPKTGQDMTFEAPIPADFQALLDALTPLADDPSPNRR